MNDAVDLSARAEGLLPYWTFPLLVAASIGLIYIAFRYRSTSRPQFPFVVLSASALTLGNILFFWRPLFTSAHVPAGGGDLNSFFFTLHSYSAQRLLDGEIPLWNPTLHGGMPHLGNYQAGLLYPPNLIAYLVSNPFSYGTLEWLANVHYLIASTGAYLLVRAVGAGRIGAVAAGLIFAYSGFMVAHLGHYSMISAAAWVPWMFWSTHRMVHSRSWRWAALLAWFVFLGATAGHQQTLLFALVGTGLWWLYLLLLAHHTHIPGVGHRIDSEPGVPLPENVLSIATLTNVGRFFAAVVTGLALAAPMILPSLQLARRSVRSTLSYEQASEFSVQPVALAQLILPTVFGSNPTDHWGAFSSGEIWGYAGVVTLVLALAALVLRTTAYRAFFALTGVVALLYALGPWSPLHGWVYQFAPFFEYVRAPARSYLYLNLALAVLAGLAISDLSDRVRITGYRTQQVLTRLLRGLLVVIGALALFIIPLFYVRVLGEDAPSNRPVIALDNLHTLLIILALLVAVLFLARRYWLSGAALGVTLTVLVVLDLFSATMPFNPTDEDLVASYREPDVAAFLIQQWEAEGPFRIDTRHPGLLPNFGSIEGLHVASGVFDPMQPAAYAATHNVLAESPERDAYDLLNVRYWLLPAGEEGQNGFDLTFESPGGTAVWERDSALPRAWFVSIAEDHTSGSALERMREDDFEPDSLVLIDDPPMTGDGGASGGVTVLSYEPERIVLEVDAGSDGYVVISDGYYPGWTASVNGDETPVLAANHGVRAVVVPEGISVVELHYEPSLVTLGALAGSLGVLALIAMLVTPAVAARTGWLDPRRDE